MKRSLATFLLLALYACGGTATDARAGIVYAFAEQKITDLHVTGTGVTFGSVTWGTSTHANEDASSSGTVAYTNNPNFADSFQSYVGPGPAPAQNKFTPVGLVNNDYVRGDVLISNTGLLAGTATLDNVAEGYLATPPNLIDTGSASGAWNFSTSFKANSADAVISFSALYSNALRAINSGEPFQSANAVYAFDFSITDTILHRTIFHSTPNDVNSGTTLNFAGDTTLITTSGAFSGTTSGMLTLVKDRTYSISIQGSENVNLTAVVPEPSSLSLVGIGGLVATGFVWRRRRGTA